MKAYNLILSAAAVAVIMSGCGGGSSSSGSSEIAEIQDIPVVQENTPQADLAELRSGRFIDSSVQGLQYVCNPSTRMGITNASGIFTCNSNDVISFYIAQNLIGHAMLNDINTPNTFFPNNTTAALNLAQLLQTLDVDGNPDNGIIIDNEKAARLLNRGLNFTDSNFDATVESYLSEVLVNEEAARQHFEDSLLALNGGVANGGFEVEEDHIPDEPEADNPEPEEPELDDDIIPDEDDGIDSPAPDYDINFDTPSIADLLGNIGFIGDIGNLMVPKFLQADQFKTTLAQVKSDASNDTMETTCQEEYGDDATLASWTQIENLSALGIDMEALVLSLSMDVDNARALIQNDSDTTLATNNYIIKYSDDYVGNLDIDNGLELMMLNSVIPDFGDIFEVETKPAIGDFKPTQFTPAVEGIEIPQIRRTTFSYPVTCYVPSN